MDLDNENINIKTEYDVDPDYESTNTAIRRVEIQEEEENQLTEHKLKTIIQEEFDKELNVRKKQLEEVEEKIFKAQKLLHILRYVLVSTYYNNKSLECEPSASSMQFPNILQGQNRIHPAIKKLLGQNENSLKVLTSRLKRKPVIPKSDSSELTHLEEPATKKPKLEPDSSPVQNNVIKLEPSIPAVNVDEPVTNRNKVQHKLVIGNISYFKKSMEQHNLTHKWMVYVKLFKGIKNGPEVTNLVISKVVFYLHPSYKPNDVVDISQPPYHLSRRGWGEFPLRLKIFFKSSMNKPVDVVHQIKLDNTFTERQTLGNQTEVPIFLYDSTPIIKENHIDASGSDSNEWYTKQLNNNIFTAVSGLDTLADTDDSIINDEIADMETVVKSEYSSENEHDYCCDIIKQEADKTAYAIVRRDHAYNLPRSFMRFRKSFKKIRIPVRQAYNELIYGLGPNYLDGSKLPTRKIRRKIGEKVSQNIGHTDKNNSKEFKVLKTVTGQSIRFLPESFNQVLLNNDKIISVQFLKNPSTKSTTKREKSNREKSLSFDLEHHGDPLNLPDRSLLLNFPKTNSFKNMGEALPYMFKMLPLWTDQADCDSYKRIYPYAARSESEYHEWNVGKRLSSEWSRAKAIRRILSKEAYCKGWSTKAIFMYGRSHLFTPVVSSYKLFEHNSPEKQLILSCFSNSSTSAKNGFSSIRRNSESTISIISPVKSVIDPIDHNSTNHYIDISDKKLLHECAFVREAALDAGVLLKPEILQDGILMNAAERVVLEAVKCFAESLIRRARNFLVCRQMNYSPHSSEISISDISRALEERKEFQSIQKFREDRLAKDFFF
ncbi:YEATS domain-containing protein 2 [Anthonomus grandis grandis]|uniref:YEATS domain-containing protein 2 n=1 Tax=Anthonomus grandis grandis TaxID=2921223 RepID=UPI0021666F1F|nr:YEATS domain-containing protein 2 [Anthonomus grandis grandis]